MSSENPLPAAGRLARAAAFAVAAALAYFASARLGYAFAIGGGSVTLWFPSGVMLGLLLLARGRDWPALVLGGFIGSLLSDLRSAYTLSNAVAAALANGTETLVAAWVVTQWLGSPVALSSLRAVVVFTAGATVLSNALTSFLGAAFLHYGLAMPYGHAWFVWWAGDGLGMLIVTPVVLAWAEYVRMRRRLRLAGRLEAAALLVLLVVIADTTFGPSHGWLVEPAPYVTFPLLFWAALRFGPVGAATGTLVLAGVALWHAALGRGVFWTPGISEANVTMQVYAYLGLASLSSLIAAAVLEERQTAVQHLRESQERYRSVVETATDAIITIDRGRRIQFANPAIERILGFHPRELVGSDVTQLIPLASRDAFRAVIDRYLTTGEKSLTWHGTTLTGQHKDGHEVPLEVSLGELTANGRQEFTGILRDVTEKRAAEQAFGAMEQQYRQSQKMDAIGQLAGGVAHDFNNLLTVIQGYGELLADELTPGGSPAVQADLREIMRAAARAASLTQQLLAFSRRQILAPRVFHLFESVQAVEPMLKRLIGENIDVVIRASAAGPVAADPGQIEQVILNLSLNSRDAMPAGGTLLIEVMEVVLDESYTSLHIEVTPGRYVVLAVSDTGVGMDAATMTRVFDPFFTTKPKGRGTGLGLSTVHGIVRQSGGSVGVYSEPGRGSTFKVYLPRADASPDAPLVQPETGMLGGTETVLVVEDEEGVRRLAERILEEHGYHVITAGTPTGALELTTIFREEIHLLLSDVVLPEMSGRFLADRLLMTRPDLAVLFMSGYTDDAIVHHGVLDPGTALLQKPFTPERLLRKVREVIDGRSP